MATSSSLLSCYILLNLFFFFLLLEEKFLVSARELVREHHVIDVKSLLPSSSCSIPDKNPSPSRLKVVHRYGQCSSRAHQDKPSHVEFLRRDQARVDYIHRRAAHATGHLKYVGGSLIATVPTFIGLSLGTANYVVTIGLGTPVKFFTFVFDTGSDLTWTQCVPCVNCYTQKSPFYDPTKSSTFTDVSCNSNYCTYFEHFGCSSTFTCLYHEKYIDGSYTNGSFIQDELIFFTDIIRNFHFGCGHNNSGRFGKEDGMLGLGRGEVSIISQTAQMYNKVFSYCLPSGEGVIGHLTLGPPIPNVQYTPMINKLHLPSWYFLKLIAIHCGGVRLPLSSTIFTGPGTMLDSGTVISRLPPTAYSHLRDNFRKLMREKNYPTAPPLENLDTCYDLSNYEKVEIPSIALIFDGEVTTNLAFKGTIYGHDKSQVCLAFTANNDDSEIVIIGNVQQRTLNIVYDVGNLKIGFGDNGCH